MRSVLIAFTAFLITLPHSARADILMIDLNGSSDEIAAAKKAALDRHEKLIVIPVRTDEQEVYYQKIHQIEFQIDALRDAVYRPKPNTSAAQLKLATEKYNALSAESDALKTKYPSLNFNYDSLKASLDTFSKNKEKFETVIMSGHHGSEYFGLLGSISMNDFSNAFRAYPDLQTSVKSVFAWGCYSATAAESLNWESFLPNLKLVGGFDGSAPGSGKLADTEYLHDILSRDQGLQKTVSEAHANTEIDAFSKQLHSLQGFNSSNGSACNREVCVGMNSKLVDLKNLGKSCDQKGLDLLNDENDATRDDVYCDTSASPLREFYNHARLYEHCASENPKYALIDANQIFRHLFLKNIWSNFQLYYANELKEYNLSRKNCNTTEGDYSRAMKCSPSSQSDLGLSTTDFLDAPDLKDNLNVKSCFSNLALNFLNRMSSIFGKTPHYNTQCLPASWVELASSRDQLEAPPKDCEDLK
jgi:hypothetical protein